MREGWEIKTFEELSSRIGDGLHGTPKYDLNGDYFFINGNNLNNGVVEFKAETKRVNKQEYTKHFKTLTSNTVLVSINGTLGNVAFYNNEPIILGKSACYINFNDNIDKKFIKYHIQSPMFFKNMTKEATGATIKNFSLKSMRNYELSYPPLQEQQQIVAILDQAFEAIDQAKANIEKNIANAKELFQSKLNAIFIQKGDGWEEKSLGEIGKVSMCKRVLKKDTTPHGEIPFYKIGTFGKKANAFISKEIYEEFISKYSFPKKGDILISASGTIGRRVIFDGVPGYFQDSNIVWIDNNEEFVTNEYLYQFYGVCDWNPSKGATIARLYNNDLRRIKISFPSIADQKNIIPKMEELNIQTNQIEKHYKQKLNNLEDLKKSILQKAFAGELTSPERTK